MKFSAAAAALALPLLAVATPMVLNNPTQTITVTATATATAVAVSQCDIGSLQCCNSVQSSSDPVTSLLLGLLGIVLSGATAQVGVTCSPITVVGVSGTSCTADPVCCENNSFNGVVAIGCTPVNLNL